MSPKYELVKKYYNCKAWSKDRAKAAVVKGWITEEEYKLIVGEAYAQHEGA